MRRFEVGWASTARDDVAEIVEYLAAESPVNALDALDRLEARAASLVTAPTRGRIVPELKWSGVMAYRELIVAPWRIVYRIDGPKVLVVSVLDARRSLEDLLLARFLRS